MVSHSSTCGRDRSRSAPTIGERRSAARIPPRIEASSEIGAFTVARMRPALVRPRPAAALKSAEQAPISFRRHHFKSLDAALRQARTMLSGRSFLQCSAHGRPLNLSCSAEPEFSEARPSDSEPDHSLRSMPIRVMDCRKSRSKNCFRRIPQCSKFFIFLVLHWHAAITIRQERLIHASTGWRLCAVRTESLGDNGSTLR